MSRLLHRFVVIASTALVTSCISTSPNTDQPLPEDTYDAIMVVSTRIEDRCLGSMNTVTLSVRGTTLRGRNETLNLLFKADSLEPDFTNPSGYFIVRRVPAGDYRSFMLQKEGRKDGNLVSSGLSGGFVLHRGKINYLGEVTVTIPTCEHFKLTVSDQRKRDAALFDARMKHLKSSDFEMQLLRVGPTSSSR